jgi:DNA-directed RNA polymerase specialized sigma24 family protein
VIVTPHQSRVLRWYYRDGKKQGEIAAILGIGQPAVAECLRRARARLERAGIDIERVNLETLQDIVVLIGLRDE